jgi:hypothetical protein
MFVASADRPQSHQLISAEGREGPVRLGVRNPAAPIALSDESDYLGHKFRFPTRRPEATMNVPGRTLPIGERVG